MLNHEPSSHGHRGFTLIELLLYISIVGGLLTTVSLFFATVMDARVKNQSIIEVNQQGVATMDYITSTIRNATGITAPSAGASAASLTLTVSTGSLSPTVFDLNGAALQAKEGAGNAIPLTNSKVQISNLSFTNVSRTNTPGIVRVSFTISRINPNGKNEYDYQKTFTSSAALRWP